MRDRVQESIVFSVSVTSSDAISGHHGRSRIKTPHYVH